MRIHALLFFFFCHSAFALYGGRETPPQKHLVDLSVSGKVFCQGTIIAPNKVLTTGHCIAEKGQEIRETMFLAYYPETVTVSQGAQKVRAKMISIAPTYFDSPGILSEDLALIELSAPLKNVDVLPIASRNDLASAKDFLLTSRNEEANTKPRKLVSGPDSLVMITDGSQAGVCQGDSGGALLLVKNGRKFIAGILSAQAVGCARKHSVSYFPRTTNF